MKSTDKISVIILLLLLTVTTSRGQQDPLSTQYMFNPMWVNPSYIANVEQMSFTGITRHQWVGFEGAPTTQFLSVTYPIEKLNFVLGGTLLHDIAGPEKQTALFLDYGYSVNVNDGSRLNFGLRGGFGYYRADITQLATINDYDPSFIGDVRNRILLNFGFGTSYITDKFYVGYSIPRLIKNKFESEELSVTYVRHHYLFGGARFIVNPYINLYPSVMAKMVKGAPPSVDISATALYQKKIGVGLMYRFGASLGGMISYKVTDNLRAGYSYDMAITRIHYNSLGTHEIMMTYSLGKGKNSLYRQFFSPKLCPVYQFYKEGE